MGTITIKKYQNKNEKLPKCYKKWYGKVLHRGTMGTDELANHIMKHGSVYTDDVVLGVTRKLMHCIAEQLAEGYKVKLDGIGTLYLGATSTGTDTAEDFDIVKNITRIGVKFLADQSKNSLYTARVMRQSNKLTTKVGIEDGSAENNENSGSLTPSTSPEGEGEDNQGSGTGSVTPTNGGDNGGDNSGGGKED